jgi:hypothetical protein
MPSRLGEPTVWAPSALSFAFVALFATRVSADAMPSSVESEARAARAQASASIWMMEGASRRARVILQTARKAGSEREVACANEALSRVDMALRVGRERAHQIFEDWSRGDVFAARVDLARLSVVTEAARSAGAGAEQCIDAPRPAEGTTVRLIIDSH